MRNKRLLAVSMTLLLALQSPLASMSVNATEVDEKTLDVTEYVVHVDSNKEFEEVVEDNEESVVVEESVADLEEENIVVMELTDEEAKELEEDKNIVVEENILFTANTMESSEAVVEETTTEIATEAVVENTEEVSTENITEEIIVEATTVEMEEVTTATEEQTTENMTQEPTTEKAGKQKKEKKNKKDKNKKEKENKKDKEEKAEKRAKIESKKNKESSEAEQWNLDAIHYSDDVGGNNTIKVALLDSGVSFDEDVPVAERITINEKNEVENSLFDDATGHGTSMAGVIAAQDNEDGIKGINPDADIYSIQILDENNQSTLGQVIAGIHKAIELDCDIINMSFGTTVDSQLLHDAIKEADKNGILMIAAAGNTEGGAVEYPAAYEEVLAVGATDTTGNKLAGSSDGAEIEIFAPGDQIESTGLFGGSVVTSGTSIAAAQVTGAASLLWSMDKEKSAGFIRSLMTNTAQTMEDNGVSDAGLLDVENAVAHHSDLEYTYEENSSEYEELQEDAREAEEFLDVKLVNGMWFGGKHESMVRNAASYYSISSTNIALMAETVKLADKDGTIYRDTAMLHGSDNYVKGLKFLYQCAWYIRKGDSNVSAITKAKTDSKLNNDNGDQKKLITTITTFLSENQSQSKTVRYYKLLGFAMHLTGDVYAHRTMVPSYTVKGTNPAAVKYSTSVTSEDARFGTNHFKATGTHTKHSDAVLKEWALKSGQNKSNICKRWNCFQRAVNIGAMEFRDIKNFSSGGGEQKVYEDNANFCKERYADAMLCCEGLLEQFYEKYEFDGIYILFPNEKNVKLNNFKTFSKEAGEDVSPYTTKEWNQWSTAQLY